MVDPNNTYVAWDGELYEGHPPAGWYLAADNRWWPPQEMIENAGAPLDDPYVDPYLDPLDDPYQAASTPPDDPYVVDPADPFGPSSDREVGYDPAPPPESWAPQTRSAEPPPRAELPPRPTSKPAARPGPRAATSRRRKKGFRPGILIPLVVFGLLRCTAESGFDSGGEVPAFDDPTIIFEDNEPFEAVDEAFEAVDEAAPEEAMTDEDGLFGATVVRSNGQVLPVDFDVPFYIEFSECGREEIPVFMANDGTDGTFAIDFTFQPLDNSGSASAEPFTVRWAGPMDENVVFSPALLAVPEDQAPLDDCVLVDVDLTKS